MTPVLHIKLLGELSISLEGQEPMRFAARRAEVLVAYLALSGRNHARETLATLLWDDRESKQALANLRSLLAQLPKAIKPYLSISRQSVQLNTEKAFWVDALRFEEKISGWAQLSPRSGRQREGQNVDMPQPHLLEEALALYRGPFLDGVFVQESRGLEEWIMATRERLERQAIDAHWQLATHYRHWRRYAEALPHAYEMVRLDPLSERGHRLLMHLLARDGQVSAALAQYENCRAILKTELAVEPAPETERLYNQIRRIRQPIPHVLPPQFTPFVGRHAELAAISERLDDPDCRLLTVLGVGGAGKTRLAIQAAGERRGDYWHGIYFVPLANVESAASLVYAIAAALDFSFEGQKPARAQLLAHLGELEMLLVLDNFEHLLDEGAPLVQAILAEAPGLQLLVTSRERLQLQAEWIIVLEGLTLPPPQAEIEEAVPSDAEQLFHASARRVQTEPLDTETAAVSHICRLVEGLPLAIELAASSLLSHRPQDIADQIQRNLDFLATQMRDVPARQRSLRATFNYSWDLLDERTQTLFARLAVFRGPFDEAAAAAVAQAQPQDLQKLTAKSLLRQIENDHYTLHEALRPYASEKLVATPQVALDTQQRHAEYYGHFLRQLHQDLDGGHRQLQAVATVNQAWDNVAAGWRWAAGRGESKLLSTYLAPLNQWLTLRGFFHEGLPLYEQAVQTLQANSGEEKSAVLGQLLGCLGFFQVRLRKLEEAAHNLERSAALLTALELPEQSIRPLGGLANLAFRQGNYEQAKAHYESILALSQQLDRPDVTAATLEGLALVANYQGNLPRALELLHQTVALHRQIDDRHALANSLGNLAATLIDTEAYMEAIPYFEESLALWEELGDEYTRRHVLQNMGEALLKAGDDERAEKIFAEALRISKRHNYPAGYSYWGLGEIYLQRRAHEQGQQYFRKALAQSGTDFERLRALLGWAKVRSALGYDNEAATYLELIQQHPATPALDREEATRRLEALEARLSSPSQTTVRRKGTSASLQDAATSLQHTIATILASADGAGS
jgi:predicted ATPase/DNA-binding SARP family transcriptional activator/TolA-binding protein